MFEDEFYTMLIEHRDNIHDTRVFKSMMMDLFGEIIEWKRNLLIELHKEGIMQELESSDNIDPIQFNKYKTKLENEFGTKEQNADWAVKTWLECYERMRSGKNDEYIQAAESENDEEQLLLDEIDAICARKGRYAGYAGQGLREDAAIKIIVKSRLYPRVLRKIPQICEEVCRNSMRSRWGIQDDISKDIELMILAEDNVCTYEDYFVVFDGLIKLRWDIDYYLLGVILLAKGQDEFLKNVSDRSKGWQWIAYFHDIIIKEYIFFSTHASISYSIDAIEGGLGVMYISGNHVEKDMKKASECFMRVIQRHDSDRGDLVTSGVILGVIGGLYIGEFSSYISIAGEKITGYKMRRNMKRGVAALTKAVEYGDATGMALLASLYEKGYPVQKDMNHAIKLYREAAEKGCEEASQWLLENKELCEQYCVTDEE